MKLRHYPEYKESFIPWLDKVPPQWHIRKLRTMLKPCNRRNHPNLPLLSVVREKGIIKRNVENRDENYNYVPDDLSNYKVVKAGQFVINKMKSWQGSYGISPYDGIVSPAYYVFDCNNVCPDYFHIAIRSKAYIPFFTQASDGVRVGQWDLSITRMKEIPFAIPTEGEQKAIAAFIRSKEKKIAKFIRNKRRLIQLLKEQKQVIINQAVTCGIDEKGNLRQRPEYLPAKGWKPSGVDWLRVIPEEWKVKRFKNACRLQRGYDLSNDKFVEGTIPVYGSNGVIGYHNTFTTNAPCITVGRSGSVGEVNFVYQDFWAHNTTLFIIENYQNDWKYLYYLLQNIDLKMVSGGSAVPTLNRNYIHQMYVAIPPHAEQQRIVLHIESQIRKINVIIARTEREIELIQEYRTRLISDVVTGKVDVRNIKVEDVAEDELLDDVSDTEEISACADLSAVSTAQAEASADREE